MLLLSKLPLTALEWLCGLSALACTVTGFAQLGRAGLAGGLPWLLAALALALLADLIRRVLRPLRRLSLAARQLAQGQSEVLDDDVGGLAEIEVLRRAIAAMAGHLQRAQVGGFAYAGAIAEAQERERERLAHELHDDTVQSLIAMAQDAERIARLIPRDAERAAVLSQELRARAVAQADAVRSIIAGLRPPALEELGLVPALRMLLDGPQQPQVSLHVEGPLRRLDLERELALFRVAQEALANARRHAQAQQIRLTLSYQPDGVALRIVDDGRGFELPPALGDLAEAGHFGLLGMRERLARHGGSLDLRASPGQGITLEAWLPRPALLGEDGLVRDPVCGAVLSPEQAYSRVEHGGQLFYFCCPVCQGAFGKEPQRYLREEQL
jgi:signal transduction histidine kinase/YHS domain-containing protein